MKNLVALVLLMAGSILSQASNSKDSLNVGVTDMVDELIFQNAVETNQQLAYLTYIQTQKAGFLKDVWKFITSPFRPVWGKFEEPGHRNQEHSTHSNNWHLDVWCNKLSV